MTSDTAALESPRCSARIFRLTLGLAEALGEDGIPPDFDLVMIFLLRQSRTSR
jgi:hypothetical protein